MRFGDLLTASDQVMSEAKAEMISPSSQSSSRKDTLVREAIDLFKQGRFQEAKEQFEKASERIDSKLFSFNIRLCDARIKALNKKYGEIREDFYSKGSIADVAAFMDRLDRAGELQRDKARRDFSTFVSGFHRLRNGWSDIPPRQPNPGHFPMAGSVLYCLHQSVPHATNGYSTRSHGVAKGLLNAGFRVQCVTRPGFPWDINAKGLSKGCHEQSVDNISYYAEAGWALNKTPLDHYLAQAADLFFRRAQLTGSELIVAASNHITGLPALMAARRLGVPFVYEVRGLWEVTQASIQPEWKHSDRFELMRTLEQQVCREADHVIAITEELAQELQSWGVPSERISIVPNAVDINDFQVTEPDADTIRELKLRSGIPIIGYAGSAIAYEGLELLIEALALLKQRGQDFVFVLVGDGKAFESVKSRATDLGIKEQCRFVGRVPFDQVQRYISCMDIMPVPRLSSAVTEMVSALKPFEAMAMGKAVVLSDVSPHRLMAGEHGERAMLFEKDNATSLSAALQYLINHPSDREQLGMTARAWIENERTWNQVTSRFADVLKRVCQHHRSADATAEMAEAKDLGQITLGLIADQFTTDTLASAVRVVPLSPDNWQAELDKQPVDAVFVESAWKGNQGQWHRKVGFYSEKEFAPLEALLTTCREREIPSLFWNKEDPVHFERFSKAASLCEHVFTTDSCRIIPYLATPNARTKTASSCPFYASPKIHNLLPSTRPWQETAAYGGTYYGKRYPERSEYMDKIMSAAVPLGLTIYDRQHDDPESPYKYPGGLAGYVAGSLSYEEMVQAYKAHPVQINVNSVLDSPTMFSRRVMEASACGAVLVSGPALGMNRYLDGAVQVVQTESEAAQALENLLHHPAYRWCMALKGARTVMRAHTTQHRLAQMLRTAGLLIKASEPPTIQLMTEQISASAVQHLLAQTLRPRRVLANAWQPGTWAMLESAGVVCGALDEQCAYPDDLWLLADSAALADLEAEDIEDLAWPASYAPQNRLVLISSEHLNQGDLPGLAQETHHLDAPLELVRVTSLMPLSVLGSWAKQQTTLALRKPPKHHDAPPNTPPLKTVLIAGHDLKFIKPFYPYFTKAGLRILLDFWSGHTLHNEFASKRLIAQADTVFCEWMLGNAIWYGKHKRSGQKLVGRLHLQEIDHTLFPKIPFNAFNTVVFVGPHILRQAITKNSLIKENGIVIFNGVDVESLQSTPRKETNGKVLGFVGIVPQRKRLDLALDILRELRKEDQEFILRIKSKRPDEYSWMASRPEEMAWYETQYRRIEEDPLLGNAVIFDSYGNDMPEWYAGIDYVLSTSDFESFHFSIADGAAAGCIPIVFPWEGSSEIYPRQWIVNLNTSIKVSLLNAKESWHQTKKFSQSSFSLKNISSQVVSLLLQK
jgi:glycosyltransferase involved in cell wall biosynthesis